MILLRRTEREVIAALSLIQASGIHAYRQARTPASDRAIGEYVIQVVSQMPFVFRAPMVGIALCTGLVALTMARRIDALSQPEGQESLKRAHWVPGYAMLEKFIRATVYLRLFDEVKL